MLTLFHFSALIGVISIISIFLDENRIPNHSTELTNDLNTTVVILNWSRPFNINKIISAICDNLFEDVIHSVVIWNNNPKPMSFENNFSDTSCTKSRIRIINSPENLYFQARYMACAEATTPYCFIQDDDYLIHPEIIRALVHRISETSGTVPSIHLQPSHEMLSSELRTVVLDQTVHTTFAWLGYGTIVKRSRAIDFLSLLEALNLSDDQHKMADNYFTILRNEIPERWFDAGIELGGGQPFTVGTEGEQRNNRHIIEATKILESINTYQVGLDNTTEKKLPYVELQPRSYPLSTISRAPCHGRTCIFETSIKLLPDSVYDVPVSSISDILELEDQRRRRLGEQKISEYLDLPPSNAVDGARATVFRSSENAKRGEWISLDLTRRHFYDKLELVLEVDQQMEAILRKSVYESSEDGATWDAWKQQVICMSIFQEEESPLRIPRLNSCTNFAENVRARYLRVRLIEDVDCKWDIHEVYFNAA